MSDMKSAAKLKVLKHLKDMASEMMGDDVKGGLEGMKKVTVAAPDKAGLKLGLDKAKKMMSYAKGGIVEDPAAPAAVPAPKAAPAATPDPAVPAAAVAAKVAPVAEPKAAPKGGTGNVTSPTKTKTSTGGSSPGGASTGGVGSGIGGAGTGGAATGGASTGGAGTVTVSISGSSSTETSSGAGAKKGNGKGGKPAGPITLNISNVGGTTDAGNVASGDGPGAAGKGGSGKGSGGGGGGAAPGEPDDISSKMDNPSDEDDEMSPEEIDEEIQHLMELKKQLTMKKGVGQ